MTEHGNTHHDNVRNSLRTVADSLELSPVEPAVAQRRAAHRRKRRLALAGAGALATVAAVGAVVANQDRGDDTLELSTPTATTESSVGDDAPDATSPPVTAPVTTPSTLPPIEPTGASTGFESADATSSWTEGFAHLLPWRDGFVRIAIEYQPQPLPEIPEEIAALFPDEVLELFPDGLPATIDEATEALSDAGLLDEVSAVLAEHPEASEAIYSAPTPEPRVLAEFTTDGVDWRSIELDAPIQSPGQFTVSGDRLVTWATEYDESTEPLRSPPPPSRLVMSWTDDLETWSTTEVDLGTPESGPSYVRFDRSVANVAIAGDRWVAQVMDHQWFDIETLLPEELVAEIEQTGYGASHDDDGVTIQRYDEAGNEVGEERFTWAELGVDGNPEDLVGQEPISTLLTATFGNDPVGSPAPNGTDWGALHSDGTTFFLSGSSLWESADGNDWTESTDVPIDNVHAVVPIEGGAIFTGDGPDGPTAAIRDADGSFRATTMPELPERYHLWNQGTTAAWVVELQDESFPEPDWEPVTIAFEHDGYGIELTDGPESTSHVVTDLASGEVVVERTYRYDDGPVDDLWEYDEATDTGTLVIRDDAGNELVRVPGDVIAQAYDEAYGDVDASVEPAEDMPAEMYLPDLWLIATADGTNWLTVDLTDPEPEQYWPTTAAINGSNVLYQTADGFELATLPTG